MNSKSRIVIISLVLALPLLLASCLPIPDMHWTGETIGVGCYGDIVPCADYTYDLGDASGHWDNVYTDGVVTGGVDLSVNCGTDKTVVLAETVWTDLSLSMANVKTPAANAPAWRYFQGTEVPAFSASQVNVLYFTAQLPHSYKEGSDIEFHIHTAFPDAVAGNVRWHFTYSWANIEDTFAAPSTTTITVASSGVTNKHQAPAILAVMNGAGKKVSSVLVCSIQRLGNVLEDNYGNEAYLISGDFHYQVDTLGSRQMLIK